MPDLAGVTSLMSALLCTIPSARSVAAAVMDWARVTIQRLKSAAQLSSEL